MASHVLTLPRIADIGRGDVRELTVLNAAGLGLTALDDDLSACIELRRLDLSKNALAKTDALADLKQLSWLNLRQNKLRALKGLSALQALTTLNAGNNHILRINHLGDMPVLKALILNDNDIKDIEGVRAFKALNALVLSHNSIEEVADAEFKQLVELRKLSLSHNALRVVPNLVNCFNLKELRLNGNKITELPETLIHCAHLCLLDVGNNQISDFGKIEGVLSQLKFLQNLNLRSNPLTEEDGYADKVRALVPSMHILDGVNLRGKRRTGDAKAAADNGAGKAQMEGAPAAKRGKPATAAQQPVPAAGKREERAVDSKAVPKRAAKGTNVASQARSKPAAREGAAAEKPAGKLVEKRADKPGRKAADQHVAAPTGKPTGKPTDTASNKPTVKPAGNTSGKPTGKSAVQPAGKPAGTAKASTKTAADGVQPKAKAAKVQPTAAKAQAKPANKPARQTPNVAPEVSGALKVVEAAGSKAKTGKKITPLDLDQLVRDPSSLLGSGVDGW